MTRAMNPDGTPWWVSTGPPQPHAPQATKPEAQKNNDAPTSEEPASSEVPPSSESEANASASNLFGITPESQAAALNAGLNLVTAILDVVSRPLTGDTASSQHEISTCGVCPLCVGVKALREHDADLADLVESAMSGVTSSAEKLSTMLPDVAEKISEVVASNLIKLAFKNMSSK